MVRAIKTFLLVLLFAAVPPVAAGGGPLIAAASDLQYALKEVQQVFEKQSGHKVRVVFGSSGNFAAQIRQGAPFQMLLSADEGYVAQLAQAGLTRDGGKLYAIGRLVLFVPHHAKVTLEGDLAGLRRALDAGEVLRFAIANPEHAPYGRAAREVLQQAGLWEALRPRLIYGENISQAAQFAATPGTSGGLIAYSLALSPPMQAAGRHVLIPAAHHQPLRQSMVLLKGAGAAATAFYQYLQSPAARAILQRHGFAAP